MIVMFVGGAMDGSFHTLATEKPDVRVRVGDETEFYRVDPETYKEAGHIRGLAHYYRTGESADSLIDVWADNDR